MGVVYRARQISLNRPVAVKVIKLGMDTKAVIARFEAERQALALMDHPGIARVFDAGATYAGRPYFVMELVRGLKITDHCDQHELSVGQRLKLFIKICQAVQHAHQKGVIHRDIKPSNILVTELDGEAVPKVIDFGIAKATEARPTDQTVLTVVGQFIGTPAYLSPEQAELGGLDIDTRSDIYSLGVLLYELLTSHLPFDPKTLAKASFDEIRRTIREQQPLRPSTRLTRELAANQAPTTANSKIKNQKSKIADDLDWIVMKCLEKDRTRRYATANGLAADLQRHLNNEPVLARPPSRLYEFQKSVRRHKAGFAAVAAVMIVLVAGTWVSTEEAVRARHAELTARQRAYAADLNVANQAVSDNNLGRALDLLNAQRPKPGQKDLRGWEWRYLWGQSRSSALFTVCQYSNQISSLAASPDGEWLAVGGIGRGGLWVWDWRRRHVLARLAERERWVRAVFSPTNSLLAFTGYDPSAPAGRQFKLHLWDTAAHRMVSEAPLESACMGLAFSQDGSTLVTSEAGGPITLWRTPECIKLASYPSQQSDRANENAFSATPNLDLAAYGTLGREIHLVDLRKGREVWTMAARKYPIAALALSPDGSTLASAAGVDESDVRLWSIATGKEIGSLELHSEKVDALGFLPDGQKLASGSTDGIIRVWAVGNRKCLDELRGHAGPIWRLALLPDGKTLASGSKDGTVCLWDTAVQHLRQPFVKIPDTILAWGFGPDSRSVLTLNLQGQVAYWRGPDFQRPEPVMEIGTDVCNHAYCHCFSSSQRFLAVGFTNGITRVWDLSRRVLLRQLTSPNGQVRAQNFFGDHQGLLTFSPEDRLLRQWDLTTGSETQSWQAPTLMDHAIAVSPDERWCVAVGDEGVALLRDLRAKTSTKLNLNGGMASAIVYSPDGRLVALGSGTGYARLWETAAWREVATLGGFRRYVESVAFYADGTRLATGSEGRQAVKLWDTQSWQELLTLEGQGALFFSTEFSPDGNALGSLNGSGVLHIWQAPSWDQIEAEEKAQQALRYPDL
jgi:WD40 repeat protein